MVVVVLMIIVVMKLKIRASVSTRPYRISASLILFPHK